jgi:hypothetical protein
MLLPANDRPIRQHPRYVAAQRHHPNASPAPMNVALVFMFMILSLSSRCVLLLDSGIIVDKPNVLEPATHSSSPPVHTSHAHATAELLVALWSLILRVAR